MRYKYNKALTSHNLWLITYLLLLTNCSKWIKICSETRMIKKVKIPFENILKSIHSLFPLLITRQSILFHQLLNSPLRNLHWRANEPYLSMDQIALENQNSVQMNRKKFLWFIKNWFIRVIYTGHKIVSFELFVHL